MDFSLLFHNLPQYTVTGLAVGAVYALVALGYTMVYGVLQLINFAHSEVFMFGTFGTIWVFYALHVDDGSSAWVVAAAVILALVVAMAMSGGVALLLERVAYRPLISRGSPKLVVLISAIGASFALSEAMGLRDQIAGWFGLRHTLDRYVTQARDIEALPYDVHPHRVFPIFNYWITDIDLLMIVAAIVMMFALDYFIGHSRLGKGIRAVAQDPETAALMGVNSTRVIRLTFLIGGLMAGAAALLYTIKFGTTRSDAGFILGIKAFTAAVMGGIGNLRGALLGGLVLGVAENWGSAIFGSDWKDVVSFVLLILILLFRPTGLLGESLGKARV